MAVARRQTRWHIAIFLAPALIVYTAIMILPLFATALIADWAGSKVCKERLYHQLAKGFLPEPRPDEPPLSA